MTAIIDAMYEQQAAQQQRDPLLYGTPQEYVEYDGQMVTPEEAQQREERKLSERLQSFQHLISKRRDGWVSHRVSLGVDRRWSEDLDMYNNRDPATAQPSMMESVQNGGPVIRNQDQKATRSTVFIGLTRNKTNAAESRLADILLPTDDKNWGIRPTPKPQLSVHLKNDDPVPPQLGPNGEPIQPTHPTTGEPLKMRDVAQAIVRQAKESCDRMSTVIEDQLSECDYNSELRKAIHWAAVLGTGVVKGPLVMNRYRRAWTQDQTSGMQVLRQVAEMQPVSVSVDPRNVFPDPAAGDDIHKGAGVFERSDMTEREVRDLAKQDGYIKDALRSVLEGGPKPRATGVSEARDRDIAAMQSGSVFERWEYWGEVAGEDLRACGALPPDTEIDVLKGYSACVVMINDYVVKAYLNPLETQELPYDFFVWEKVADVPWGLGIPRLMHSQQRVLNAAWRMMMDNAALSAGPQIIIDQNAVEPVDQRWEITGRKLWRIKAAVSDIKAAMGVFNIDNNQQQYAGIIDMAGKLADDDTGVPQITQGEQTASTPDTLGGMQLLMNAANVVLRRLVKRFDDSVTRPHIRRYYDFNMEHNPDESIKGDFSVDARGSSALLVRDIQNQGLMQLLAAWNTNPVLQAMVKVKELFKKALQAQHIDTESILYPDEEIDQRLAQMQQNQPQAPQVQAAQIRADAALKDAAAKEKVYLAEIEANRGIAQDNAQAREREYELRIRELELKRDLALLDYASKEKLTLAQTKTQLADTAIRERTKKELFVAEAALKTSPDNPSHEGI